LEPYFLQGFPFSPKNSSFTIGKIKTPQKNEVLKLAIREKMSYFPTQSSGIPEGIYVSKLALIDFLG
jgi:hypothetical protein